MTEPKKSNSLIRHIVEPCTRMSNHGVCDNTKCLLEDPSNCCFNRSNSVLQKNYRIIKNDPTLLC